MSSKKSKKDIGKYYENSTQKWLPIDNIRNGVIILKDGRYIKVVEVLPVNFYLKSEVEQENIIYYFSSYLKIAPDNLQIRVLTQRADIEEYLDKLSVFAENEINEACCSMIYDEMDFVKSLSDNSAVKKRFFIVFEYSSRTTNTRFDPFVDAMKTLADEAYKAQRYLSQCGIEVLNVSDDGFLVDLFYGIINKHTSKFVKPGNFAGSMFEEVHMYEGGESAE